MTQTYSNYHREYYHAHKREILERTREYRRKYAREYYLKQKEKKKQLTALSRVFRSP